MPSFQKTRIAAIVCISLLAIGYGQAAEIPTTSAVSPTSEKENVETLVCIRHGEKPAFEIGQLSPRGLNRALALPKVLLGKYGKPQFIFAPDPAKTCISLTGKEYCYIRPLATIEPTAILCGLPVNTFFGFQDIQGLESELRKPVYRNAVVFVAWEHLALERFVRNMVVDLGGNGAEVPTWDRAMGYDAIYLIKITTRNGRSSVAFSVDHEGLNNLSDELPSPVAPLAN